MKIRDHRALELERADSKIREAELACGQYDADLEAAEHEAETAAEVAYQADSAVEEAKGEKEKIQENLNETTNNRHDLQVSGLQLSIHAPKMSHFFILTLGRPSNAK